MKKQDVQLKLLDLEKQGLQISQLDQAGMFYLSNPEYQNWVSAVSLFAERYVFDHPLYKNMTQALFFKNDKNKGFRQILGILNTINHDQEYWDEFDMERQSNTSNHNKQTIVAYEDREKRSSRKQYDVFISHANSDKLEYVEDLYSTLSQLGISIFYDTSVLNWGDKWKDKIIEGTEQSEFAVIVISENFFGREWAEIELGEFLKRQNESGQKVILPLLFNITIEQLKEHYPDLGDIQVIKAEDYTKEQIAILLAKVLIERYKN